MNYIYISLVFTVIIALYVYSYYQYPKKTSILQTSMADFKFDAALQKQLLVIDDTKTPKDVDVLCEGWFRFNFTTRFDLKGSEIWHVNRYKWLILQATEGDGELYFCPASNKSVTDDGAPQSDANIIALQLSAGQTVIVPLHYRYMVPIGMNVSCFGAHDVITYLLP
jgi:hypothetical protein